MARKHSRRFRKAAEKVEAGKRYPISEGIALLKSLPGAKFDEAVDVAVRIGIDAKKTEQLVRGSVSLPKGTGKSVKIAVFAEGDRAKEALEAGADFVGGADLADKIDKGFTDFDMTIASPDMMKYVGKLGRVLGPQGKMPSPKAGTVTDDVALAVKAYKGGKVEYRVDAGANVAGPVGKASFDAPKLAENIRAFVDSVRAAKPNTSKGEYLRRITVSSTMSPGIQIEIA